ncbi:MAG TPA: hypothetical protein VLT59_04535, partial [Steroidobacteraceae bacterium]|nr:hypothetical protein [Steroidobacteraceae bacterium]
MTLFLILCAVMLTVAVLMVVLPLWRPSGEAGAGTARRISLILPVVIGVPVGATLLYSAWSNFDWNAPTTAHGMGQPGEMEDLLGKLEERLAANPADVEGWVLLGRSMVAMGQFDRGLEAYRTAYDLTGGQSPDVATGYAEALALRDEAALSGQAGQIFEQVLESFPDHPKALWYGSIMALRNENLPLARERMERLLAQDPPEQIRQVLEQQIATVAEQLGDAPATRVAEAAPSASVPATAMAAEVPAPEAAEEGGSVAAAPGSVSVAVSISPALAARVDGPSPVFVMARDANAPGPPLTATRIMTSQLPTVG